MYLLIFGASLLLLAFLMGGAKKGTHKTRNFDTQLKVNATVISGLGFAEGTKLTIRTDRNNLLIEDGIKTIALQYSSITNFSMGSYKLTKNGISVGGTVVGAALFGGAGAIVGSRKNKDVNVPLLKIDYNGSESGELILTPFIFGGKVSLASDLHSLLDALKKKVNLNEETKII